MRKLKLEVDGLKVDSFGTDEKGQVLGHDTIQTEWCTGYPECISRKCDTPHDTCYGSCGCTNGGCNGTVNCA